MSVATMPWEVREAGAGNVQRPPRSAKSKRRRARRGEKADMARETAAGVDELASMQGLIEQAARSLQEHMEREAVRWAEVDRVLGAVAALPEVQSGHIERLEAVQEQMSEQQALQRELTAAVEQVGASVQRRGTAMATMQQEIEEGPIGELAGRLNPQVLQPALEQLGQAALKQQDLLKRLSERQEQMQQSMREAYEQAQRQMMIVILVGWLMLVLGIGVAGTAGLAMAGP